MCRPSENRTPPGHADVPHNYWVIHGQAYDLSSYVALHPGGADAILLGCGRDCTELFEQYHVMNNKHLKVLENFRVFLPSVQDGPKPVPAVEAEATGLAGTSGCQPNQSDPFHEDIKLMVREHGSTKMLTPFVILHLVHLLGLVYSLWLWYQGAFISAFLLPFFLWVFCAAMVHDGGHFALSRNAAVNKFLNVASALITNSSGCWYLQHNILHHSYTNLHSLDCDLDSHHPYMRIHPEQSIPATKVHHMLRLAGHLGMYLFAHMGLTLISPITYFRGLMARWRSTLDAKVAQDVQTLTQYHASIVLQVATTLAFYIIPFLRFSFGRAWLLTFFPTCMMSLAFMVIAQVSHIQMDAQGPSTELAKLHWARRMALTSVDYSQSSYLVAYLTIGLNMQSLHHIIPSVSYTQLPALYPAYRAIAAKHGVQLRERRNLGHALMTHLQTLWALSKTHTFAEAARKLA